MSFHAAVVRLESMHGVVYLLSSFFICCQTLNLGACEDGQARFCSPT